jgi:hypothetical protein
MHVARLARKRESRSISLVPVLPTEPVTATTLAAPRAARPRRRLLQRGQHVGHDDHRDALAGGRRGNLLSCHDRSAAPALSSAAATKSCPSKRLAGDGEEGLARLQRARVDRSAVHGGRHEALDERPDIASTRRSPVHSGSLMPSLPQRLRAAATWSENGSVTIADDLAAFMAFAGDHQRVPSLQQCDTGRDRLGRRSPISLSARRRGQDRRRGSRPGPRYAGCRR